ncbi:MAG TPA: fibronectin type III domain-containing protein, partial [Acidothermaceae bacterium]|nr:fibronectin type III domain-containing protein [Acidothermaceae bacterium]
MAGERVRRRGAGRILGTAAGLIIFSTLAPTGTAAAASIIYVGGQGCSDSGAGTQSQPYCTISKAAAVATAGAVVQVATGTYQESVSLKKSGSPGSPITFTAAAGAAPVVTGGSHGFSLGAISYVTINGFTVTKTTSSGIYLSGSSNVTISNNHVSYAGLPASGATAAGIQLSKVTDSLVSANIVDHNTVAGIYLTNGTTGVTVDSNVASWNAFGYVRNAPGIDVRTAGNTITRNVSHDNEDSGLQFYPGANNNLVAGNLSYHNKGFTSVVLTNCNHPKTGATAGCITGDHGIDDLNVTGNRIIGNSVYDNVTAGINVEGTSGNFTIANNVSVDNAINCPNGAGGTESCPRTTGNIRVDKDSTVGTTLHQDLVYLHLLPGQKGTMMTWMTTGYATLAAFQSATGQEQAGIQADPLWVDPANGDMHLNPGSPAIDSADSGVDGALSSDIEGKQRVDDPATPNTGVGPRAYDDRGAYEYQPGAATTPGAPSATAAGITGGAQISWTTPDSGGSTIIGYNVYRGTAPGGEGTQPVAQLVTTNSYADSGLAAGTTYYYTVTAVNGVGEGPPSAEVTATSAAASAPAAPVVSAVGQTQAALVSWTAPSDGGSPITNYNVYRATTPGGEGAQPITTLSAATTSYQDSGLVAGTTYYYQVSAVNSIGEGARSAEMSATATAPANLVGNASFEAGLTGWNASGGTLSISTSAHSGSAAAAIAATASGATPLLNDSPDWNKSTQANTTCVASAWVQGPSGLTVVIRL